MLTIDHFSIAPSLRFLAATLLFVAAGCSPVSKTDEQPAKAALQEAAVKHPVSGLEIIEVAVVSGDARHVFKAELADTPEAQTRGLMFRTELGDDEAMIFPSDVPQTQTFWMRNTPISLDIIFIGTDQRITNIAERTEPYSLESLPSEGLATAVLEIRGGLSDELGIAPGDAVEYQLPDNPVE